MIGARIITVEHFYAAIKAMGAFVGPSMTWYQSEQAARSTLRAAGVVLPDIPDSSWPVGLTANTPGYATWERAAR